MFLIRSFLSYFSIRNYLARFLFIKIRNPQKRECMSITPSSSAKAINWRKVAIWIGAILIFIVILLVIGGFILQNRLPEQLKSRVSTETEGVYKLDFDKMDVSLLSGSVELENIRFLPDTGAYFKTDSSTRSADLFQINAVSLDVSGLKVLKLIFNKTIQLSSITLNSPEFVSMKMVDTVEIDSNVEKSLYERMPSILKGARIGVIRLNNLSFVNQIKADTTKRGVKWSGLNLTLESIFIDSLKQQDTTSFLFSKDIRVHGKVMNFASTDGMYKFTIGEFRLSTKEESLEITDFKVIPQYPEIEFTQRMAIPGDRYNFVFSKIFAQKINFNQLEREGNLGVAKLILETAELRIFNNKSLQGAKIDKTDNFPHIAIKKLDLPLTIDSMQIRNFDIYYKELNPNSGKSGTAFFTKLYGTFHNITNDSIQLRKDPWCRSSFQTNFLGNAKLLVDINMNMADQDGEFNYKGSLGSGKSKVYNELLEPLAMVKIEDGSIRKISFDVNANRYGSSAKVLMLYDNLKVSVLGKDGKVLKKKGLLSFLANSFLVKNSNPRKEGEAPIEANIIHVHSQDASFFNLMWKSIFAGLKVNLGIPDLKK